MKYLFSILVLFSLYSCAEKVDENNERYVSCTDQNQVLGLCIRYMDREIYYSRSTFDRPEDNDQFDVIKVMDSFNVLATNTGLGENYFNFKIAEVAELEIILDETIYFGDTNSKFKSFFLILGDARFNELYAEVGSSDPNAIVRVNMANKKQFFMVFRASCFIGSDTRCTNNGLNSFTPSLGVNALVARSVARLIGIKTKNCIDFPVHVMCTTEPNDGQWGLIETLRFFDLFDNQLETIRSNNNYYEVYFPEE